MLQGDGNFRDVISEVFNASGCSSVSLIFLCSCVSVFFWRIPFSLAVVLVFASGSLFLMIMGLDFLAQ